MRRKTISVQIGNITIGGDSPIRIESMTKCNSEDGQTVIKQIKKLEKNGCEIVRIAIPTQKAVEQITKIKNQIKIPLVGDIHFDYKLAISSIEQGIDGIRLNPGNINKKEEIRSIVKLAKQKDISIRVGVNAGSIDRKRFNKVTSEILVTQALEYVEILENFGFYNILVSLKAFDIATTVKAYELASAKVKYPFHLGITESGTLYNGIIRSAIGIGILLAKGIGDTIRVSLTASPEEEVKTGYKILQVLNLRNINPVIISCPTCGRCKINLMKITKEVEKKISNIKKPLKVAIMGCVVNGPGEAKDADIGIAAGKGIGILFKGGKIIEKVKENEIVKKLVEEIKIL